MEDTDSDDSSTQSDDSYKTAFEEIDIYDDDSFYIFITKDGTVWLLPIPLNFSLSSEKKCDSNHHILVTNKKISFLHDHIVLIIHVQFFLHHHII